MNESPYKRRTEWVVFVACVLAGLVGTLLGIPWGIAVLGDARVVALSATFEFLLLLVPGSASGVWLGRRVCPGSQLRETVSGYLGVTTPLRTWLLPGVFVGLGLGGVGFVAQKSLPEGALIPGLEAPSTTAWLLRCLSAALTEEIFFRFGLLTLFAWLVGLLAKKPASCTGVVWVGNLFSAVAFAFAHLPQVTPGSSFFLIAVAAFSTAAGIAMGWLYMRRGLSSAVVGHLIADVVVYVIPRIAAA